MTLMIQDPITTNTGAPTTINMDVYIAGGPDFQLSGPCGQMQFSQYDDIITGQNGFAFPPSLVANVEKPDIRPQGNDEISVGAESTNTSNWTSEAIVIGPAQHESQLAEISGERFSSLRDLLKARSWCTNAFAFGGFTNGYINNVPHYLLQTIPWPVLSAFIGIRGSVRITLSIDYSSNVNNPICVGWTWLPNLYDFCQLNANVGPAYNTGDPYLINTVIRSQGTSGLNPGIINSYAGNVNVMGGVLTDKSPSVTIEIPYNWITRVFPTYKLVATFLGGAGGIPAPKHENPWGWLILSHNDGNAKITLNCGFADDMRLGRRWRHPAILVETNNMGQPQWSDV